MISLANLKRFLPIGAALAVLIGLQLSLLIGAPGNWGAQGDDYILEYGGRQELGFSNRWDRCVETTGVDTGDLNPPTWRIAWSWIAARATLQPIYEMCYRWFNYDHHAMHLFFFAIRFAACVLLYFCLLPYLGIWPSVIGAGLFATHPGPHEVIIENAGGLYWMIILLLSAAWLIATRHEWRLRMRFVTVYAITTICMLLYEIPLALLPAAAIAAALGVVAQRSRLRECMTLLCAFAVPILLHISLVISYSLVHGTKGIWQRDTTTQPSLSGLIERVLAKAPLAVDAAIGSRNTALIHDNLAAASISPPSWFFVLLAGGCVIIALVASLWASGRTTRNENGTARKWQVTLLILTLGAWLLVGTPLIGAPISDTFLAGRFTIFCSLGMAVLLGCALHLGGSWVPRLAIIATTLVLAVQVTTLNSILRQWQDAQNYDQKIHAAFIEAGLPPGGVDQQLIADVDDRLFGFSIPHHPHHGTFWRTGFSRFESGHAVMLVQQETGNLYRSGRGVIEDRPVKRTKYTGLMRRNGESDGLSEGMPKWKNDELPDHVLVVDDHFSGRWLTRLSLVDGFGGAIESQSTPGGARPWMIKQMSLSLPALASGSEWVEQGRPNSLTAWRLMDGQDVDAAIAVRLHPNDGPLVASLLAQGGSPVLEITLNHPGDYILRAPWRSLGIDKECTQLQLTTAAIGKRGLLKVLWATVLKHGDDALLPCTETGPQRPVASGATIPSRVCVGDPQVRGYSVRVGNSPPLLRLQREDILTDPLELTIADESGGVLHRIQFSDRSPRHVLLDRVRLGSTALLFEATGPVGASVQLGNSIDSPPVSLDDGWLDSGRNRHALVRPDTSGDLAMALRLHPNDGPVTLTATRKDGSAVAQLDLPIAGDYVWRLPIDDAARSEGWSIASHHASDPAARALVQVLWVSPATAQQTVWLPHATKEDQLSPVPAALLVVPSFVRRGIDEAAYVNITARGARPFVIVAKQMGLLPAHLRITSLVPPGEVLYECALAKDESQRCEIDSSRWAPGGHGLRVSVEGDDGAAVALTTAPP